MSSAIPSIPVEAATPSLGPPILQRCLTSSFRPPHMSVNLSSFPMIQSNPLLNAAYMSSSAIQLNYNPFSMSVPMPTMATSGLYLHPFTHVPSSLLNSTVATPFVCPHTGCPHLSPSKFSLTRHLRKHNGFNPHPCPYAGCPRKFGDTTALARHKRIHTGEKPFPCGFPGCDMMFSDPTNVKRHQMTHTGMKPYKCGYLECGKEYSRLSSYKTHCRNRHNAIPIPPLVKKVSLNATEKGTEETMQK